MSVMTVPNPRRHRPIADMALTLMEGTLYYLYALTFTAWFAFPFRSSDNRWHFGMRRKPRQQSRRNIFC
jgi:hypothetical protein